MGGLETMGLEESVSEAKRSFSATGGGVSGDAARDGTTGVPARDTTVVESRRRIAGGCWSWSTNQDEMNIYGIVRMKLA